MSKSQDKRLAIQRADRPLNGGCKACGQSWWVADPVTGECPGCRIAALEAEWNRLRAALDERCVCEEGHRCGFCAVLEEGGDDV